ncbi:hypothetical protein A8H37_11480 [Burkholderia thailandensis]|nr:hypothetical protein A8H37_11480 [Burkholderia thailandensis]
MARDDANVARYGSSAPSSRRYRTFIAPLSQTIAGLSAANRVTRDMRVTNKPRGPRTPSSAPVGREPMPAATGALPDRRRTASRRSRRARECAAGRRQTKARAAIRAADAITSSRACAFRLRIVV